MSTMHPHPEQQETKICWLTPDYFLEVDARIVPELAKCYNINWILIKTHDSGRMPDGLLSATLMPQVYTLRHRQRDPRIALEYMSLLLAVRRSHCALVYTSFHGLPYFFPLLALLLDRTRVIYGVHNVSTPKGASREMAMRLYQRFAFTIIERFHVFSQYQLATIKRLLPQKKHYYAPLSAQDYGPSRECPPTDKLRFLFFGCIREYKRLDLLIRSFQTVCQSGLRNIELVIAGSCDHWEKYQSLIGSQACIKARIGMVANRDIPDLIASSHYVVLPYQDGAQSGVLAVAYRYKRPVITSDIDAFKHVVVDGSTGFLFQSGSQKSLTAVMTDVVLRHNSIYDGLQANIAKYVTEELSVERILPKYKAFLDDCLSALRGAKPLL
jgi:glycosyltransferase involved in cell wall biosynthesis